MGSRKRSQKRKHLQGWKPMTSQKKAREITSKFHRLSSKLTVPTRSDRTERKMQDINAQLSKLGGREAYQDASILLTGLNKSSSKWTFQCLTKFNLRPKAGEKKPKVLEIGAINTQLLRCPWLDVKAIDLCSRHHLIEQIDFFKLQPDSSYDCVVNAMVLNSVPTPKLRGRMLQLCNTHLRNDGLFVLVLPKRCISLSSGISEKHLKSILEATGKFIFNTKIK